jgi:hypothetical protein
MNRVNTKGLYTFMIQKINVALELDTQTPANGKALRVLF